MKQVKERNILFVIMIAILVLCFFIWHIRTTYRETEAGVIIANSDNGVWDLSNINFDNHIVHLNGNVEYISNVLLTPEEFEAQPYNVQIGSPNDVFSCTTAKITVILPDDDYYIIDTYGDYARNIYINGEWRISSGVVGETIDEYEPGHSELLVEAQATNNVLELIIQGANFSHINGSPYSDIYIGKSDNMTWYTNLEKGVELFTIGMLFTLFVIHIILAATLKAYPINSAFSFLCITWCVRFSLTGNKLAYSLIPDLPWEVAFKIEYITIALTCVLVLVIMLYQFGPALSRFIVRILNILLTLFVIAFIFLDTYTISSMLISLQTLYVVAIIFAVFSIIHWIFIKHSVKILTIENIISLLPLLILFFSSVHDAFYYNRIYLFGLKFTATEVAILAFSLCETVVLFFITMKNINESKIAEQQSRIRAEELERFVQMKSHFMGIVAHEIKTPLSIIIGGASESIDILQDIKDTQNINENEQDFEDILTNQNVIIKTVKNLNETVFDLLDTTALETGRLTLNRKYIQLENCINDVVKQYKLQISKSTNILNTELTENLPPIYADEKRLQQVLLNLLSNSLRHTRNGILTIKLWQEGEMQYFSVSDNGSGISKTMLNKLTTDYIDGGPHGYRGGIGLLVCQQIVRSHGGEFEISSAPGKGTVTKVCLKMKKESNDNE